MEQSYINHNLPIQTTKRKSFSLRDFLKVFTAPIFIEALKENSYSLKKLISDIEATKPDKRHSIRQSVAFFVGKSV